MTQSTTISGRPNATLPLSGTERIPMDQEGAIVSAGAFVFGQPYKIASLGTTDFTLIGATANTIGLIFVAIGAGAGTGTAATMTTVDATVQDVASLAPAGALPVGGNPGDILMKNDYANGAAGWAGTLDGGTFF